MSNSRPKVPQELRKIGVRTMTTNTFSKGDSSLTNLPSSIGDLKKLEYIYLDNNNLTSLPSSIGNLEKLEHISLKKNSLESLPSSIGNLKKLQFLMLNNNNLTKLPSSIGNLTNLIELNLKGNNLTKLPESIGNLTNLKILELDYNNLTSLPESFSKLTNLEYIGLTGNKLTSLPDEIGRLPKLKSIYINGNPNLRIIPRSLKRSGFRLTKSSWTKFEHIPIVRRNVPLNTKRNDPISGYNFSVGNNALNLGYNKYLTEKSLLNWIKTKNNNTNITNINTLYSLSPNTEIVINPFTRQPLFRRNLNFVKFVKPNTPNTLANKLNKTKINNKPKTSNSPKTIRKKAGNAAQSRRTNVNNNNR